MESGVDRTKLASTWIEVQFLPEDSYDTDERIWASHELWDLASDSPTKCWDVILEILSLSDDEWVLENLGAGPLESMLALNPDVSIALIEKEFPNNKRLQTAASHVWQNRMPDNVWNRLQALLR